MRLGFDFLVDAASAQPQTTKARLEVRDADGTLIAVAGELDSRPWRFDERTRQNVISDVPSNTLNVHIPRAGLYALTWKGVGGGAGSDVLIYARERVSW